MQENAKSMDGRISFRPVVLPEDEEFLQEVYGDTRDDLRQVIGDDAQLRLLLEMQYAGQRSTYAAQFPNAKDEIILLDGEPVGRLLLDHRPDSIHGVDIAILKSSRNTGVGTAVLIGLFNKCAEKGIRFTLNVTKNNPAIRLYERLGCRIDADNVTHYLMIWNPS